MQITSAPYFAFLILVFFGYWLLADKRDWRIAFLAIVSYFFYSHAGLAAVLLLFAVSTIDFTTTRLMSRRERHRKLLLWISLAVDIGALCVFKYANFFLDSACRLLSSAGLKSSALHLNILAPVGISF